MTIHAISPFPPSNPTLPELDETPLPIDRWHLRHRVQSNGRALIEITDHLGDLAALITSTTLPMLSVDAAWRGHGYNADGAQQWWALAIGHASNSAAHGPAVTFTRRAGRHQLRHRAAVQPLRTQGLWIAWTVGLYTAVSCRQETVHTVRRLVTTYR